MNPFQPLYDVCNSGDSAQKYADLPDFPHTIDLEPTSSCNFRCLMCPTGNLSLKRDAEFMKWATFEAIADQAADYGTALRLIGWGEPTLHPLLPRMIRYAHERGLLTHLNTNGSKITPEYAFDLVDSGLSSVKFSFQGVDRQSYAEMRQVNFFDGMIEAIRHMKRVRGYRSLPYIAASTSITYEKPADVEIFRKRLEPLVDQLSIGKTIFDFMDLKAVRLKPAQKDMLRRLKLAATDPKRHPDPCPEVFGKLSVHANGDIVVCCNDYDGTVNLGNVNRTPIIKMWRHEKIEAYRERLSQKDYDAPLCRTCFDYQELTAGVKHEAALVG